MNRLRTHALLLAMGLVIMAAGRCPVKAESGYGGMHRGDSSKYQEAKDRIFKKLDLTDEQKQKLDEHRKAHREEAKKLHEELKGSMKQLKGELEKEQEDLDVINKVSDDIKMVRGKLIDHRIAGVLAVKKILTHGQFKKFNEIRRKHMDKKRKKMKKYHDKEKKRRKKKY